MGLIHSKNRVSPDVVISEKVILVVPKTRKSNTSSSKTLKEKEIKATDLEIVLFYDHVRELFVIYLSELEKQNELYLYEIIEKLKKVEFKKIHVEFQRWFQLSFMKIPENIDNLEIISESKSFLQSLRTVQQTQITTAMIRQLGGILLEVELLLNIHVQNFVASELFLGRICYDPPILALASSLQPGAKRNKTLLLVTANLLFAKIFSQLLHLELNYDVIAVNNGRSATPYLMSRNIDAVLIGSELPDKGGIAVIKDFIRLEDMCKMKIPFYVRPFLVCLMSRDQPAISDGAIDAGFDRVVTLPCTVRDFEKLLPPRTLSVKLHSKMSELVAAYSVSEMRGALGQQKEEDENTESCENGPNMLSDAIPRPFCHFD